MTDNRRTERLAEGIREQVAMFLGEGAKDPRISGLVTVTGVDVTRDKRQATIFVSVLTDDEGRKRTLEGLDSLSGHLRGRIGRALQLRHAPELEFRLDGSIERAARIDSLLNQIKEGQVPRDEEPAD